MNALTVSALLLLVAVSATVGFSFSNCGEPNEPIQVEDMLVRPDPLYLGKNMTVGFKYSLDKEVGKGTSFDLKVWKKVLGIWTLLPCIGDFGSCYYEDFCGLFPAHECEPIFKQHNIPCKCPFTTGTFLMPPTNVPTKDPGVEWLTEGSYAAQGELFDEDHNRLGCLLIYLDIGN